MCMIALGLRELVRLSTPLREKRTVWRVKATLCRFRYLFAGGHLRIVRHRGTETQRNYFLDSWIRLP